MLDAKWTSRTDRIAFELNNCDFVKGSFSSLNFLPIFF